MSQKGKIRKLQEDLTISRQVEKALSEYCEIYKKRIKELEKQKLRTHNISFLHEIVNQFTGIEISKDAISRTLKGLGY